jgi:hypothetical protein
MNGITIFSDKDERIAAWLAATVDATAISAAVDTVTARGQKPYLSHICKQLNVRPPDAVWAPVDVTAQATAAAKSKAIREAALMAAPQSMAAVQRLRAQKNRASPGL